MTHRSSAPLTSAAFLSGGQQVALGTMTGQVFIHDLRSLRTPLATISAHTKAVTSIIVQPVNRTAVCILIYVLNTHDELLMNMCSSGMSYFLYSALLVAFFFPLFFSFHFTSYSLKAVLVV